MSAEYGEFKQSYFINEKGRYIFVNIFKKNYSNLAPSMNLLSYGWDITGSASILANDYGISFGDTLGSMKEKAYGNSRFTYNTSFLVTIRTANLSSSEDLRVRLKGSAWRNVDGGFANQNQGVWVGQMSTPLNAASMAPGSIDGIEIENVDSNGNFVSATVLDVTYCRAVNNQIEWTKGSVYGTSQLDFGGEPVTVTWNGEGSTRNRNFLGSECKLQLNIAHKFDERFIYDVLDSDSKEYMIKVYDSPGFFLSSRTVWTGWMQTAFDVVENQYYPFVTTLTANDSYGLFNDKQFEVFDSEDTKQINYTLSSILSTYIDEMQIGNINLVENGDFIAGRRNWRLDDNDVVGTQPTEITINCVNDPGTRRPLSMDGSTLVPGQEYQVAFKVMTTSGTLYIKDGGGANSTTIGTATISNSPVGQVYTNLYFTWTQRDNFGLNGEQNGLHFYSTDFIGTIKDVRANNTLESPLGLFPDYMNVNMTWQSNSMLQGLAMADQFYICKGAFADNTNFPLEYKVQDVFNECLKIFNLTGFQDRGTYWFIQPNNLLDPTNFEYFPYNKNVGIASGSSRVTEDITLTIDQTNHVLLGGSVFTYEPSLNSVSTTFTSVDSAFNISGDQEILSKPWVNPQPDDGYYTYGGQMSADTEYMLDWFSIYSEEMPVADVNIPSGWTLHPGLMSLYSTVFIKAVSSSGVDYLTINADGDLEWQSSYKGVELARGMDRNPPTNVSHYSLFDKEFNESTRVGAIKNSKKYKVRDGDIIRIVRNDIGGRYYTPPPNPFLRAEGDMRFQTSLPQLDATSSIYIKIENSFEYVVQRARQHAQIIIPSALNKIYKCTAQSITLETKKTNSLITNEFRVVEYNQNPNSSDNFDLDSVKIGVTSSDPQFSIVDALNDPISDNLKPNISSSISKPFTQLLAHQYLDLQKSPLQILQGSIFSEDISPIKVVRYSIDDDGNYEDYAFLGGTLKLKSSTMDGEWYRLKDD